MNSLHEANIIVHVLAGTTALLIAFAIIISKKGTNFHIKSGRIFLIVLSVVIVTGLIGVFVFNVNSFLLVTTILSGYNGFSGYSVLKNKENKPKLLDISVAILSLSSGVYYVYYMNSIGMFWAPVITYSLLGGLALITGYDLLRYSIPVAKYKSLWLYEHIYKMVAAFTALLAAAVGTVLPQFHPHSQFLPSVFGMLLSFGFLIHLYRQNSRMKKSSSVM